MSEAVKEKVETHEPFRIVVDQEDKAIFPKTANSLITSTRELDKTLGVLFSSAFADFYGLRPEFNVNTNKLTLAAAFVQREFKDERVGFHRLITSNASSGFRRIERIERVATEGNRFVITDDAMEALEPFMTRAVKDKHGNVNWKLQGIITQESDNGNDLFGRGGGVTYNVVHNIDPIQLIKEVYGRKANVYIGNDDNGNPVIEQHDVEYNIIVLGPVTNHYQGFMSPQLINGITRANLKIDIQQIDAPEVEKSMASVGMYYVSNLGYDTVDR